MKIVGEFDFRNAKALLSQLHPKLIPEVISILSAPTAVIDLSTQGAPRDISAQIANYFSPHGWKREQAVLAIPDLKYDLVKYDIPLEIEIGHQRLVYADFFKFLADYANERIPAGVMLVTGTPKLYGHSWHNSLASTKKKLEAVSTSYLVPIFMLAIDP